MANYLLLYTVAHTEDTVHLLTIRHHRPLSFDFARLWPSETVRVQDWRESN